MVTLAGSRSPVRALVRELKGRVDPATPVFAFRAVGGSQHLYGGLANAKVELIRSISRSDFGNCVSTLTEYQLARKRCSTTSICVGRHRGLLVNRYSWQRIIPALNLDETGMR